MVLPRMTAAICVFLLIVLLALAGIEAVNGLGSAFAQRQNLEHSEGTIGIIYPDQSFVLMTKKGQKNHFHCRERCLRQWSHIERHFHTYAHTDVYYKRQPGNVLVAIDVD
jgi:hypothetical protein